MFKSEVNTELRNVKALRSSLHSDKGPIADVLDAYVDRYRKFTVRRFDHYSQGGGNWPPVKRATVRKKGHNKILVDTRFLRLHLAESIRILERSGTTLTIGFEGPIMHPTADMELKFLERIHDQGLGNVPRRRIIVLPDDETKRQMSADSKKIITKFLNRG